MSRKNKVAIVSCSNAQKVGSEECTQLKEIFEGFGMEAIFSKYIFERYSVYGGSAEEKAAELNEFFGDENIKSIFDISGGDIANEVLPYLDFELVSKSKAEFFGYSDLSTVINAIYTMAHKSSSLYQVRNLLYYPHKISDFKNSIVEDGYDLYNFKYEFIQGSRLEGVVVGGNLRCFLKLAGTEYFPDTKGKILLIESFSGGVAKIATCLAQLSQLGVFKNINGIILGTFTEMEKKDYRPSVMEILSKYVGSDMPICKTMEIGHGDSKAIKIGEKIILGE